MARPANTFNGQPAISAAVCTNCGASNSAISHINPTGLGYRRTRRCLECKATWRTIEIRVTRYEKMITALHRVRRVTSTQLKRILKELDSGNFNARSDQ